MKYKKKGKRANTKTVNSVATPSSELPSKEENLSYINFHDRKKETSIPQGKTIVPKLQI